MPLFGGFKSLFETRLNIQSRFELLREAISGTMSSFYMARDKQTGKVVGLKILDAFKTKEFEDRFKGLKKPPEGEIGGAIDHPNVVKIYDHGVTTSGQPYIVMEYLDGPGLNSLVIGRSPLLEQNRISLLRQAAESALGGAQGGIHPPRCVPAELRGFARREDAQIDRLWAGRAEHARVPAARKPDGDRQLHGAGGGSPQKNRRTVGCFCVRRYRF